MTSSGKAAPWDVPESPCWLLRVNPAACCLPLCPFAWQTPTLAGKLCPPHLPGAPLTFPPVPLGYFVARDAEGSVCVCLYHIILPWMVMQFIKIFRKLFEIIGSLVEPCKIGMRSEYLSWDFVKDNWLHVCAMTQCRWPRVYKRNQRDGNRLSNHERGYVFSCAPGLSDRSGKHLPFSCCLPSGTALPLKVLERPCPDQSIMKQLPRCSDAFWQNRRFLRFINSQDPSFPWRPCHVLCLSPCKRPGSRHFLKHMQHGT